MKFTIATTWNDLNDWQLQKIAKLILMSDTKQVLSFWLVYYLFIEKPTIWNHIKLGKLLLSVPLKELYPYTTFLVEKTDRTKFPEYLNYGTLRLKGPNDRLSNLSIDQFSLVDILYYRWSTNKEEIELNRFVSALYTPEDKIFSRNETALTHSQFVTTIPLDQKLAILLAYIGSREYLTSSYPHIFPKSKAKTKEKSSYHSFDLIINKMSLSVPQPFGNYYKTKEAKLYDFMTLYATQLQEQKEKDKKNEYQ